MLNKKQQQGQLAERHGIITEVFCQHFTSEIVEQLMRNKTKGNPENQIKTMKELKNAKTVKMLVHEGKTASVFCQSACIRRRSSSDCFGNPGSV